MINRTNDAKELNVHRTLTRFSQNAWISWRTSLRCSEELLHTIRELLKDNYQPSDDLVGYIFTTIDSTLFHHYNNSRRFQRRSRTARGWGNLWQFDRSLYVLYAILRELKFERLYNQIDGTLFCRHSSRIFIFPGYPSEFERGKGWHFSHRTFLLPYENSAFAQRIPLDKVQHVVHNVKDLLNILHLTNPKRSTDVGLQLCLKGQTHFVYNGPDLIWLSPRPPSNPVNNHICPSLDPDNSRYGCFRLTLPFRVIEKKHPKVYRVGTRKYNQEHCHSFLFTSTGKNVTFIEESQPIQLTSSEFVKEENPNELSWLCYRDDVDRAWDLLDFAVSASELHLAIKTDKVCLDFINHSNPCVPSIKTRTTCDSPKTKTDAMKCFLKELKSMNIEVLKLRDIFDGNVYNDLAQLTV